MQLPALAVSSQLLHFRLKVMKDVQGDWRLEARRFFFFSLSLSLSLALSLKANEMAECSFQSQQPLVCDTFKNSDGLSRVAFVSRAAIWMGDARKSCVVR